MENLKKIGIDESDIYRKNIGETPEKICREQLTQKAYRMGADVILIENINYKKCKTGIQTDDYVEIKGRA